MATPTASASATPPADRILVCVAWPYAKTSTHVGQIVGSFLPGDIFARYHRHAGHKVLMVSGSDAHGTPITVDADREGIPPGELAARYHAQIVEMLDRLGVSFDLYTITTTENHYRIVQDFFLRLLEQGYIFKDTMESPYCPNDRRFLPDRYVLGTCPFCGFSDARGDQCDNCGRTLDAAQLINPRCRLCGSPNVEIRPTEHFFLDLPKLQDRLKTWLETNKEHWRPSVLNFALTWIREGLRPADEAMLAELRRGFVAAAANIEVVRLRDGLAEALGVARAANRYLDELAPWRAIKTDREGAATTLYTMIQVLNGLKVLFAPYLPHSSQRLHELLGFSGDVAESPWRPEAVTAGRQLPVPTPLFQKFEAPVAQEVSGATGVPAGGAST
jgi:methionyl-tRNA synthetase